MWLKIEADLGKQLKVSWGTIVEGSIVPHRVIYNIAVGALHRAGNELRNQLAKLAEWSGSNDAARRREILRKLARAGSTVRYELFNGPDTQRADIEELKEWIAEEYRLGDHSLAIHASESVHVPWGLIFDVDPNAVIPNDAGEAPNRADIVKQEISQFGEFWCLKRTLWVTQSGNFPTKARIVGPHDSFGLLSLYNGDVVSQLEYGAAANTDPIGRRYMPPIGEASSADDCYKLIGKAEHADILFYFLGHHKNLELDLGGGQAIGYSEFGQIIDELAARIMSLKTCSWGLLFINACGSAVGDDEISLRRIANKSALCGIIATEAIVPMRYAAKFGERFLNALVDRGKCLADSMSELYHDEDLWPECLLYGYYAHPSYRVIKAPPPGNDACKVLPAARDAIAVS